MSEIDQNGAAEGTTVPAGTLPFSVTVDPSGRFAYVAMEITSDVAAYSIDAATGALTAVGATVEAGANPQSVAIAGSIE